MIQKVTYAFDPELIPIIEMLPERTSEAVPVEESRRLITDLFSSLVGDIDRSGVQFSEEHEAGVPRRASAVLRIRMLPLAHLVMLRF